VKLKSEPDPTEVPTRLNTIGPLELRELLPAAVTVIADVATEELGVTVTVPV
jgi:hypothetical protein